MEADAATSASKTTAEMTTTEAQPLADAPTPTQPNDEKAPSSPPQRLHSTVRLNQFTLQFEDHELEKAYEAFCHRRKKALWLRSLIPATAFHILFGLSDCLDHPATNLLVTVPARVFLSVLQLSIFILVQWDLIAASETTMLLVSICNGIPTLLLYALQRTSLHQWDALFVVFGLSFYTIPKITPLGFVASLAGSWLTAVLYAVLCFFVLPPPQLVESVLGFVYCAPVIGIFNTISYYSEYNSRERFVLRRRLRSESITLAVSRIKTLPSPSSSSEGGGGGATAELFSNSSKFALGVLLWAATTLGGWTSLPEMLKFVDEETGWAWFSHCAGVTLFLLVMTRQLQWLFVVPVLGAFVLWMLTLTMPAQWIIISAHSVGYGLLIASIVMAMGVFSRFVSVWKELVAFLTRSCFLYPQLQAGLQDEYPLLVKIVSEYTAGMDPAIISSREFTSRGLITSQQQPTTKTKPNAPHSSSSPPKSHGVSSRASPRRRGQSSLSTAAVAAAAAVKQSGHVIKSQQASSQKHHGNGSGGGTATRTLLVEPRRHYEEEEEEVLETHKEQACNKMVSVLPSFKAGKCFFCSKNEAEHLVPACGMWGKWTHWRMSQQQDILFGSLALPPTSGNGAGAGATSLTSGKPAMAMCTSYYDVQQNKSELEQQVALLESSNEQLHDRIRSCELQASRANAEKVQLLAELRALDEKRTHGLQRQEKTHEKKMEQILNESNQVTHAHKIQLRELESQNKILAKELLEVRALMGKDANEQVASSERRQLQEKEQEEQERELLRSEVETLKKELAAARAASTNATAAGDAAWTTLVADADGATPMATLTTLQPSKRLPLVDHTATRAAVATGNTTVVTLLEVLVGDGVGLLTEASLSPLLLFSSSESYEEPDSLPVMMAMSAPELDPIPIWGAGEEEVVGAPDTAAIGATLGVSDASAGACGSADPDAAVDAAAAGAGASFGSLGSLGAFGSALALPSSAPEFSVVS